MIDILFSLAGLVILIKGKVHISTKKAVTGGKARLLGVLFLLCLPFGYLLRICLVRLDSNVLWVGFVYPALLIIITIIFSFTASSSNSVERL